MVRPHFFNWRTFMPEFPESPPLFLTARQLAERLGLRAGQIRTLAREGRIPEIVVGKNTRRYEMEAVVRALTNQQNNQKNKEASNA